MPSRGRMSAIQKECSDLRARNSKLKISRDRWKDKALQYEKFISSTAVLYEKQYLKNTAVKKLLLEAKQKRQHCFDWDIGLEHFFHFVDFVV